MKKYIYYLHNINDLIPRYVGCTTRPIKRLREHKYLWDKRNDDRHMWISSIGKDNIEMRIIRELGDEYTNKQALALESQCIRNLKSLGFPLTNSTNEKYGKIGPLSNEHKKSISEANKGYKHTDESIQLMSKNAARYWKGAVRSDEYKKLMSDISPKYWQGKQRSEETKKKISESSIGKIVSEETKRKTSESIKKHWILRRQRLKEEK